MLRHLPAKDYDTRPWKNGQGLTDEVLLLPEAADRDVFDVRVSRATISDRGLFSAFPGVDRIITVIEGEGLTLNFNGECVALRPLTPHKFDSGLTPEGVALGGRIRVFNVMAARDAWSLGPAWVQYDGTFTTKAMMNVVFAVEPSVRIGESLTLAVGDTVLVGCGTAVTPGALIVEMTSTKSRG